MIRLRDLTKRYGDATAVDALNLDITPGRVTGFLGPNGAGKTTTMRMVLDLVTPTSGTATISGQPYSTLRWPLHEVGALLDARALHPRGSAYDHLLAVAHSNGIAKRRVHEALQLVGLDEVGGKYVGGFSLGMGQRLGIAATLLGDPPIVMLDEPVNGLDPDGVLWVRGLLRSLAAEGRTVFVSSHLMSEMQQTTDHLVVIGRGCVLADQPLTEMIADSVAPSTAVNVPDAADRTRLHSELERRDVLVRSFPDHLQVSASASQVGDLAYELGIRLHMLHSQQATLEEAYMKLTASSIEYTTEERV